MKGLKMCSNSILSIIFLLLLVSTFYPIVEGFTCKSSRGVRRCNKATLTINSFEKGGSGGGASECDDKFHSDKTLIVALSTRWFNHRKRCLKKITIFGNGRKVNALVVDECDSSRGCPNNIVDGSPAVWKALGVPKKNWGEMDVFWSDA